MRVIIAGGGTGGHLYPGVAIAEKLSKLSIEPLFIVSNRGIERNILTPLGYKFIEQKESPLKSVSFLRKIESVQHILGNIVSSIKIIKKDDIVVLLGGFASFSAGVAAIIRRNPIFIHEQNSVMGLSNRIFSKVARKIFLSFENSCKSKKAVFVGNPVRSVFRNLDPKSSPDKRILLTGGSQGSRFLNNLFVPIAQELINDGYSIIHQTGEKLYDEVINDYDKYGIKSGNLIVKRYIDDMGEAIKWADLVISRAGAGSIYEIMYSKRYGIFIPFAGATDNHQEINAKLPVEKGIGVSIKEKMATPEVLLGEIKRFYNDFDIINKRFQDIKFMDSAEIMIKEMGFANV